MKIYVATTEYQDLILGTEATTPEECERRMIEWCSNIKGRTGGPWDNGSCMAEIESKDTMFIQCTPLHLVQSDDASRKYIKGFRTGEFIPAKIKGNS